MHNIARGFSKHWIVFGMIVAMAFLVGCDAGGANEPGSDEPPSDAPEETGTLEVTATISGSGTDADGFTVTLDGATTEPLAADGTVTFDELDPGTYTVALDGLDLGCLLDGDTPQSAEVTAGETATVTFDITCEQYTGTGTIVFVRTMDDGTTEIYAMDADGSNPRRLTNNNLIDQAPALPPDGTKVAFVRWSGQLNDQAIWVMNADGSNPTQLTSGASVDRFPAWSPDGTQIVFESDHGDGFNLYVMDAEGSTQTQITDDPAHDMRPAWSPDGERIAFIRTEPDFSASHLYTVHPDGTEPGRLIEASETTGTAPSDPSWSPDGSQIAYRGSAPAGIQRVFVADADGSNAQALTPDTFSIEHPSWSPGGDYIAFSTQVGPSHRAIQAVRASDGWLFRLTDDENPDSFHPAWSVTAE